LRDPALFGTWITRILINECHSFERRSRKYLLQREVQSAATNPEEVSDVRIALNGLPEKLRLPLVLHYLEGYSYAEISKMLRVRQSTVRSRLSRARDALCIEITENEGALK
jgi:RNA polymerase sigma-70 factor (ECF subfamily)